MFKIVPAPVAVLVLLSNALGQEDRCDMKQVEDGLYCPACDAILEEDEIMDKEFCKACAEEAKENGEKPKKAEKVKVCVKTYHACPSCGTAGKPGGKCEDCGEAFQPRTDRARIVFKCENCGKEGKEGEPCGEEDCKTMGAKIVRTCSKSGRFPHVKE